MADRRLAVRLAVGLAGVAVVVSCSRDVAVVDDASVTASPDFMFDELDLGASDDAPPEPVLNACGDELPGCFSFGFDPNAGRPFPRRSDRPLDPLEADSGISTDLAGYLRLYSVHRLEMVWFANPAEDGHGTVSRLELGSMREAARYPAVTCSSLAGGSTAACDGQHGCCTNDDPARYAARKAKEPEPAHLPVPLAGNDTAPPEVIGPGCGVGGEAMVLNHAPGGQASVTRIAADLNDCIDRSGDRLIQTSSDANGDGRIDLDCNDDHIPDDLAGVKALPCLGGRKQEYFGLDDECVLYTTAVGGASQGAAALALGAQLIYGSDVDSLVATAGDRRLERIDGPSGLLVDDVTLPESCAIADLFVDYSFSYAWTAAPDGTLCWTDVHKAGGASGVVRGADFGRPSAPHLGIDRDWNIWLADGNNGDAWRYAPDRSALPGTLSSGWWTQVKAPGHAHGAVGPATAIVADSRSAQAYFMWMATEGQVVAIPGSTVKVLKADQEVDGSAYAVTALPGHSIRGLSALPRGADLYLALSSPSMAARIPVDKNGVMTAPDLASPPNAMTFCPAGDRCELGNPGFPDPGTRLSTGGLEYDYGDLCRPLGQWSYVITGCTDGTDGGPARPTRWAQLQWDADVPPNTTLSVAVRGGPTQKPDAMWAGYSPEQPWLGAAQPLSVAALLPGHERDPFLEVRFTFKTQSLSATPRLRSFRVGWRCD